MTCWLRLRRHRWSAWYWCGSMSGYHDEAGWTRHCLDCLVSDGWNRPPDDLERP
jgi:hypothetical protein